MAKKIDVITLFPELFDWVKEKTVISRAFKNKLVCLNTWQLRDFSDSKYGKVDDTPYGGGAGMILKVEPLHKAINAVKETITDCKTTTILLSPSGERLSQKLVTKLASLPSIIFICGRYEGVDERITQLEPMLKISIGDYVLSGGELPAMVIIDAIVRQMTGVLGNINSLAEESFNCDLLEYPQYTKPKTYLGHTVPEILTGGNHKKIKKWRIDNSPQSTDR